MGRKLRIDAFGCIWLALGILLLPLNWLLAALMAVAVHELCHWAAAKILGVRIYGMSIGAGGCLLEIEPMENRKELICAGAGPLGSLALLFLIRWLPRLAICGGIQGLYNLLPIYPLDGGRIFRCAAASLFGERVASAACRIWEEIVLWLLLFGALFLLCTGDWGCSPLVVAVILGVRIGKAKNSLQTGATRGTIELPFLKR